MYQTEQEQINKIIQSFDRKETRQMLADIGQEAFRAKFLSIATNLDLSDVDDPELQPVFIKNIDKIIESINTLQQRLKY